MIIFDTSRQIKELMQEFINLQKECLAQINAHARLIIIVSNMAVIKEIAVNACIIFREDARPFIIAVRE